MCRPQSKTKPEVLLVTEGLFDRKASAVQLHHRGRRDVGEAGGKKPRLVHALVVDDDDGAHVGALLHDFCVLQLGGAPAVGDPLTGELCLVLMRDDDIAAEADDVVPAEKLQRLRKPLVTETSSPLRSRTATTRRCWSE